MNNGERTMRGFQQQLTDKGYDAKWDTQIPEHPGITQLISLDGTDHALVFMEIHYVPLNTGAVLIQFCTVVWGELAKMAQTTLKEVACHWNEDLPLGHFGVYEEGHQFYHKYSLLLDPATESGAVSAAMSTFHVILLELKTRYLDVLNLVETCAEAEAMAEA